MFKRLKTGNDKTQSSVVLALLLIYVFFVLSYIWYLPNYDLLRISGNHISAAYTEVKTGMRRSSDYTPPIAKGVWLEKVAKTTPETKRSPGVVLIGVVILLSSLFAAPRILRGLVTSTNAHRRGHTIFTSQYAYLSLRTFRI